MRRIETVRFSLIMATLGRTEEPKRFLASLQAQSHRDFDLIVVDQNPDDRLNPILAPYRDRLSILHLRAKRRGASRARNLGLRHVSGDAIAFPDDDCWYPPNLLARVANHFMSNPGLDAITGRTVDVDGKTTMGRFGTKPIPLDKVNVWARGIEAAIFLRWERVQEVCFDEDLGVGAGTAWGAGEATDYLLQLLERGASLYYDPGLIVIHPSLIPPYDAVAILKAYTYGCGMGYVLKKHKLPLWFKAKWLIRPLGGAVLSLSVLRLSEAVYRWNSFRGRLRGMLS